MIASAKLSSILVFLLGTANLTVATRKITIDNQCSGTIYPAFQGDGGSPTGLDGSAQAAGWEQAPGTYSFNVPDGWNTARIWARTGCTLSGSSLECVIGGCAGNSVTCTGSETGGPGATLAEFTLDGSDDLDSYDMDGYNLGMEITPSDSSCTTGTCGTETDILTACDPNLVYPKGSDKIYSCASPCLNSLQFQEGTSGDIVAADPLNALVCCQMGGVAVNHADCPNTYIPHYGTAYYSVMKSMCKGGYVYADDDLYEDAVFTCGSTGKPDYNVTFCPNGLGSGVNPPAASSAKTQSSKAGDNSGNVLGGPSTVTVYSVIPVASGSAIASSAISTVASISSVATAAATISTSVGGHTTSSTEAAATASTGTGTGHHTHTHTVSEAGVGAVEISSTSVIAATGLAAAAQAETTTFTSAGAVVVEVIQTTVVVVARDTDLTPDEVAEKRDVGCLKGKRWIGSRQVDCASA